LEDKMAILTPWVSTNNKLTVIFDSSFDSVAGVAESQKIKACLNALQANGTTETNELFQNAKTINVSIYTSQPTDVVKGSKWDTNTNIIKLDRNNYDDDSYVSLVDGRRKAISMEHVFVHELVHATTASYDLIDPSNNPIPADVVTYYPRMLGIASTDWIGATVEKTNIILNQVYLNDPRGHYINTYGDDVNPGAGINPTTTVSEIRAIQSFTHGLEVDVVVQGSIRAPMGVALTINRGGSVFNNGTATPADDRPSRDLIIAYDTTDTIFAGFGRDFVYGGAGDDVLYANGADAAGTDFGTP
jgi:hypothetical protein